MEAQSAGGPTDRPKTPSPQAVADEKQLRQSADPSIQLLALQFQATRCGDHDALAGRDDPDQPLVTCSQDGKTVYLLGKTIIDGESIRSAGREYDKESGRWVVNLEFDNAGVGRWAQFTASNIGTQVAFTLDTAVLSAPEIVEAMSGGRTQIAGNFTEGDARDLAAALQGGALPFPLILESSTTETVPLQESPTVWRIGLLAAGVVVVALVIGGVLLLVNAGRGRGAPPGYAADVTRYTS
jgi:preprotein translocase subunit SecD